ncbi:Alpha/Beta hydrolase protein [Pholiota molesta]|nr:Alpha/Beta hydrolase protein [Pholiota molesta]
MKPNAYTQPPPFTWDPVELRRILPIYPPPGPLDNPPLPSPPRKPSFVGWTLSTHLFPACYLRTTRPAPEPLIPPPHVSKDERKRLLAQALQELKELRTSRVTDGYPQVLWNCVNRYVRTDLGERKGTGLTLSFYHANGFPKEIFEPTLEDLFNSAAATLVDEVWVWEAVQHGDAALVNAPSASGIFDWYDNGRDIANFLLHFIPTSATSGPLPTHLPRVSPQETAERLENGFTERKLVAIGHSFGGCTSALAATLYPHLFSALYLIDPVILQPDEKAWATATRRSLAPGALSRRASWPSRAAALASFQASPFFSVWDPRVLQHYVECGLTDDAGGGVRLKMSGVQEAVVFAEEHSQFEVFCRVAALDPRVALRWATPGRPGARELGIPGTTRERVWVRRANATNTRITGGGHLIPQEAPQELAEDLSDFLLWAIAPVLEASQAERSPPRASL